MVEATGESVLHPQRRSLTDHPVIDPRPTVICVRHSLTTQPLHSDGYILSDGAKVYASDQPCVYEIKP